MTSLPDPEVVGAGRLAYQRTDSVMGFNNSHEAFLLDFFSEKFKAVARLYHSDSLMSDSADSDTVTMWLAITSALFSTL